MEVSRDSNKHTNKPWKQSSFENSQQKAHDSHRSEVLHAAQTHRDGSPREHEESNPVAGLEPFQHVIAGDFEECVGDQEDHESYGELEIGHVGLGEEIVAVILVEDLGACQWGGRIIHRYGYGWISIPLHCLYLNGQGSREGRFHLRVGLFADLA